MKPHWHIMKCREIIEVLERYYPRSAALGWDNVGLLIGSKEKEVQKIFVALDVTDETLEEAVTAGADMIITHHPMLFSAVKKITADDFIGRRIIRLIQKDIAYYAMHTNFDVKGMADLNADALDLRECTVLDETGVNEDGNSEGIGRAGVLEREMELSEFAAFVKRRFGLNGVLVYGETKEKISRAAVSGGSGKSMVQAALAKGGQVLVTGDIDYHTAIDAAAQGLCIVDAGHYGTESMFIGYMKQRLGELFPDIEVETARIRQPFIIY